MRNVDWRFAGRIGGMMAGCGGAVAIAMLWAFGLIITDKVPAVPFVAAAMAGGGMAGLGVHFLFGRDGMTGAVLACLGGLAATVAGGILAGILVLPLRSLDLVATALVFSALSPILILWMVLMSLVHVAAQGWRRTTG